MLSADPERPERHGRLSTSELVHHGDVVALHRVWRSQRSPVCGGASAASTILGTCKPKSFTCNVQKSASRGRALCLGFISSRNPERERRAPEHKGAAGAALKGAVGLSWRLC